MEGHPIKLHAYVRHIGLAAAILAFTTCFLARAQSTPPPGEALSLIANFAETFCTKVQTSGKTRDINVSTSADAELVGLVKKLADLGFRGAAKYKNSEFQGTLQQDLLPLLKNREACKLQVWNDLKDRLLPVPQTPQTALISSPSTPKPALELIFRSARLLRGTTKGLSVLELTLENRSKRPVALSSVVVNAETDWGERCEMGDRNPPQWQTITLNWKALSEHLAEEDTAVWTEIAETPIIVAARFKSASCSDYSHRLDLKIPVQNVIPESGLARINFRISEQGLDDVIRRPLSSWESISVEVQAEMPVKHPRLAVVVQ
jgi:hypothetical protein